MKLPKGWIYRHSAYYYRVPRAMVGRVGKTWFRLGTEYPEALKNFAELLEGEVDYNRMSDLLARYLIEVTETKKKSVRDNESSIIGRLLRAFGEQPPHHVNQQDIYKYLDFRRDAPVSANRDIALLSSVFKKAIRWGAVTTNPCTGIEKHKEKPRDRYISDEEFARFYNQLDNPMLKVYIPVKYITGQRQRDVLNIHLSELTDEGIYFINQKTNKKFLMEYSAQLKSAINDAKRLKRKVGTMYLFATRTGTPYSSSGFKSIWQRAMKKYADKGYERFTEHDIRAKTASDTSAEHANEIMRHNSIAFTDKVYRRKLEKVRPLK